MTSGFTDFTARLCAFMAASCPAPAGSDGPGSSRGGRARHELAGDGRENLGRFALELFALQFTHNPAYRRFCESRGVSPETISQWTQLPAMPTAAFKELEVTCLSLERRARVFHSSGTTEQRPSRHWHSLDSLAIYERSVWPWFWLNVISELNPPKPHLQLVILTPPTEQSPHSSLVHMFDIVRRQCGAPKSAFLASVAGDGAWALDCDGTQRALRAACDTATPVLLLGTAFSFVHLLDVLIAQDFRFALPPGSRVLETGGYKGRSRSLPRAVLQALIAERLGIPPAQIVCEYGMCELSSQAYDLAVNPSRITDHASRVLHFPPWAHAQVVSPETGDAVADGETGLLRVFDLANVFSVVAVQTEDLGIRRGDGFELIGRAHFAEARGCSLMAV